MRHEKIQPTSQISSENPLLTVIITIRVLPHYDMIGRLRNRLLDTHIPETVSFLVVDEGSAEPDASLLASTCRELGFRYVRTDSKKPNFCAATARNAGASASTSQFIMHEDVDLFPYPGFYSDIIDEISIQELHRHSNRFITVPALYLSEEATIQAMSGRLNKNAIIHDYLTNGPIVNTCLPASSAIVVNRAFYLSIGGYNDQFNGWGLEDLEYAYRLTRSANSFLPAVDFPWLIESGYASFSAYRGWRSQFRLHGDMLSRKGIFIFHAWHPKDNSWRNTDLHGDNKQLFRKSTANFDAFGHTLPPLPALERGRSLMFGKGTFAYNMALLPLWGDLEVKGYQAFEDTDIATYVAENGIDRIIFTNPYANEQRLAVYNRVREAGIQFYVVERGALTDSMFIDDTGFCCESTRYRREYWPELNNDRISRVNAYISSETSSSTALEKQGDRLGGRGARHKLGIPSNKKILFVPFQSRSDTTVNHFSGDIGSFDNFVSLVRDVTKRLPSNWVVLFKKHPLSSVEETVPGAIDIGNMHIKDVLEMADYVLLMNSGVGVLSILFNTPVIYAAQAFYADDTLNRKASTTDRVLELLREGFAVDQASRFRFLSYLIDDFYSFGKFTVTEKAYTDNAKLTITERIDYYRVNLLGKRILDTVDRSRHTDIKAPIYDIFREWMISRKIKGKSSKPQLKPVEVKKVSLLRRPMIPVVRMGVRLVGNKKDDVMRFNADPSGYFAKLKNPRYRLVGKVLFGSSK